MVAECGGERGGFCGLGCAGLGQKCCSGEKMGGEDEKRNGRDIPLYGGGGSACQYVSIIYS